MEICINHANLLEVLDMARMYLMHQLQRIVLNQLERVVNIYATNEDLINLVDCAKKFEIPELEKIVKEELGMIMKTCVRNLDYTTLIELLNRANMYKMYEMQMTVVEHLEEMALHNCDDAADLFFKMLDCAKKFESLQLERILRENLQYLLDI